MIHLGTCAWNFEDWQDVFYPPSLASNQQLTYYAQFLSSVEIDSTFYHIPRADVVAAWAERTPDDFVFTAKMPKLITHEAPTAPVPPGAGRVSGQPQAAGREARSRVDPVFAVFPATTGRGRAAGVSGVAAGGEDGVRGGVPARGMAHAADREAAGGTRGMLGRGTISARWRRKRKRRSSFCRRPGIFFTCG